MKKTWNCSRSPISVIWGLAARHIQYHENSKILVKRFPSLSSRWKNIPAAKISSIKSWYLMTRSSLSLMQKLYGFERAIQSQSLRQINSVYCSEWVAWSPFLRPLDFFFCLRVRARSKYLSFVRLSAWPIYSRIFTHVKYWLLELAHRRKFSDSCEGYLSTIIACSGLG